ncbi:MAG: YihY/virulence factor BrkB family protein, partial [Acidobacteria bacterium]|nr:YihY/virulence factor BrkB family protein [Acidobacteriota bacterium]
MRSTSLRRARRVPGIGKEIGSLLLETFAAWHNDKAPALAAALAFYTLFSIVPTLLVAIAIAGLVFGHGAAQLAVVDRIRAVAGQESAGVVRAILENAANSPLGITTSAALMLIAATGVFVHLQNSLNTIWEVMPKPGQTVKNLLMARFISFLTVLAIGLLLVLLLAMSAA